MVNLGDLMVLEKLEKLVLKIVSSEPGVSRTQLVKLAYLSDREYFKNYQRTLSDTEYILYFYGPYSHDFKNALSDLKNKNLVKEGFDGVSYRIFTTESGKNNSFDLEEDEDEVINNVITKFKKNGQLVSVSAIKKYVYNLEEVKNTEPFETIKLA